MIDEKNAYFISRYNYAAINLYIKQEEVYYKYDILKALKNLNSNKTIYEFACYVGNKDKKVKIRSEDVDDALVLKGDKFMLQTVLGNITNNAIKFSNPNGNIYFEGKENDDVTEILIRDEGVGMDDSKINDLFRIDKNVSTTGTKNETGSGLGLIICKEFVEKHRGSIKVNSKPEYGTTFSIILPN